jgi:hypothetical protein
VDIISLLTALEDFIKAVYPASNIYKQTIPLDPQPNSFVLRIQKNKREVDTAASSLVALEFQVIYYGTDVVDTLEKIDNFSHLVYQNSVLIPILDTGRYMRCEDFAYTETVKTEKGVDSVLGILAANVREMKDLPSVEAIKNFNIRIQ